jgi:dolichyl-phosphate beta-glucosyltransferase
MPEAPYLSVIVPAYDEEARLPRTLARLREYYDTQQYAYDVTVVSDGSRDRTVAIVREFDDPRFHVIDSQPNRGKGYVVRLGMLQATGEVALFCDADLATPQEETEKLLAAIHAGADIAIGSRPLRDSRLEVRQPLYRELLGRTFNKAVQLMAVRGIDDTQCGFKAFRRAAAQDVFSRAKLDGFGFDFETLMIARDLGYRIDEIPIRWAHQEGSKVNMLRDGTRMLGDLVRLRMMGKRKRLAPAPPMETVR